MSAFGNLSSHKAGRTAFGGLSGLGNIAADYRHILDRVQEQVDYGDCKNARHDMDWLIRNQRRVSPALRNKAYHMETVVRNCGRLRRGEERREYYV